MSELVVHLFEAIEVDKIEDQVAMIRGLAFRYPLVRTHGLIQIRIDHAGEVTAIASLGQRIGQRGFLQFAVGFCQRRTALFYRRFQPATVFLQSMGA